MGPTKEGTTVGLEDQRSSDETSETSCLCYDKFTCNVERICLNLDLDVMVLKRSGLVTLFKQWFGMRIY